jgi:D-glycero-alpha-D-manno-heptose-7-phosphate kinase
VSGAGGGGFIMFVVNPSKKMQVVRALDKLSGRVTGFNFSEGGTHGWKIFDT